MGSILGFFSTCDSSLCNDHLPKSTFLLPRLLLLKNGSGQGFGSEEDVETHDDAGEGQFSGDDEDVEG